MACIPCFLMLLFPTLLLAVDHSYGLLVHLRHKLECCFVLNVDILFVGGKGSHVVGALVGDAAERFGLRESQKLRFLGE